MKNAIPAGYVVEIDTWENDGDNGKNETIYGLTRDEALLKANIAKMFYSTNAFSKKEAGFGNKWRTSETKAAICTHILSMYRIKEFFRIIQGDYEGYSLEDIDDIVYDTVIDLVGSWNEGEMYRVVESVEVSYIPMGCVCLPVDEDFNVISE